MRSFLCTLLLTLALVGHVHGEDLANRRALKSHKDRDGQDVFCRDYEVKEKADKDRDYCYRKKRSRDIKYEDDYDKKCKDRKPKYYKISKYSIPPWMCTSFPFSSWYKDTCKYNDRDGKEFCEKNKDKCSEDWYVEDCHFKYYWCPRTCNHDRSCQDFLPPLVCMANKSKCFDYGDDVFTWRDSDKPMYYMCMKSCGRCNLTPRDD